MRCPTCREALSAELDGEEPGSPRSEVDAHLAACVDCRAFAAGLGLLRRRTAVRAAAPVPDLGPAILARAAAAADRTPAPASRITSEASGRRWALLTVGVIQLLLALPPILLGREAGASVHLAHELGAWDLALAVALVLVAFRPERAPGLVPFTLALVGAMVVTAAIDVLRHRAQLPAESHHVLNLAGAWLLWSIARHEPEQGVLLHGLRRSGPSLTAR